MPLAPCRPSSGSAACPRPCTPRPPWGPSRPALAPRPPCSTHLPQRVATFAPSSAHPCCGAGRFFGARSTPLLACAAQSDAHRGSIQHTGIFRPRTDAATGMQSCRCAPQRGLRAARSLPVLDLCEDDVAESARLCACHGGVQELLQRGLVLGGHVLLHPGLVGVAVLAHARFAVAVAVAKRSARRPRLRLRHSYVAPGRSNAGARPHSVKRRLTQPCLLVLAAAPAHTQPAVPLRRAQRAGLTWRPLA